jgi:acyl carrier protein
LSVSEGSAAKGIRSFILRRIEKKAKLPSDADLRQFDYIEAGYVDSIGIIKFVMEIESEFDIAIDDADMLSCAFRRVDGVIALVESKVLAR